MIPIIAPHARDLITNLRHTGATKVRMQWHTGTGGCTIYSFIPEQKTISIWLGVPPAALNLLSMLNDMSAGQLYWKINIRDQAEIWRDHRITEIQVRSRSFKQIADLLETLWFTNASLRNL